LPQAWIKHFCEATLFKFITTFHHVPCYACWSMAAMPQHMHLMGEKLFYPIYLLITTPPLASGSGKPMQKCSNWLNLNAFIQDHALLG
jgi:hypothetical protein